MVALKNKIKILALSGSLRPTSSNAMMLEAIEKMMPDDIEFFTYKGIGTLPHFDDASETPLTVNVWRKHLQEADGVLICTPEYAFGVPGSLKNALDWTVGSGELVNKPVALITASTGGEKAHVALLQILLALSANIPDGGSLLISFIRSKLNAVGEITDAPTLEAVRTVLGKLLKAVRKEL